MARDFSKNTANYLSFGTAALGPLLNGAGAISIHCWAFFDSFASVAGASDDMIFLQVHGSSAGAAVLVTTSSTTPKLLVGGRSQSADSFLSRTGTTTLTTGSWLSLGGVMNIAGDTITPYYNGTAEGGGAAAFGAATYTQGTPTGADGLGAGYISTTPISTDRQMDGQLAECAIWNGDIGAAGFAQLAKGISARYIRPDLLVVYAPLVGKQSPERDIVGGKTGTITGTVAAAVHPRVARRRLMQWRPTPAVVGGLGIPIAAYHYNHHLGSMQS